MKRIPKGSVQMCCTSPPYWGLRSYGIGPENGELGLESTPQEYVEKMVEVFRLVRDLLADDGTLWLNLGDSYANDGKWDGETGGKQAYLDDNNRKRVGREKRFTGLKAKDLVGIPWRVAFALQADGWYLRQDIIWAKPNPMPESVRDRCTKSHEYFFLLSKRDRYFYDAEAIAEPVTMSTIDRVSQPNLDNQAGSDRVPGKTNGPRKAVIRRDEMSHNGMPPQAGFSSVSSHNDYVKRSGNKARKPATERGCPQDGVAGSIPREGVTRNKRSVWTVTTQPYSEAHFATFPPELIKPCILAGSRPGDVVFDPFMGSGTTAQVALELGRQYLGCELNPEYARLCDDRTKVTIGLPLNPQSPLPDPVL